MKNLFDQISYETSQIITQKYSSSFSMGIKALHPSLRNAIYGIYGYVRLADEIVDSFHDYKQKDLLELFEFETLAAIENKISLNPVLNSFQHVVHEFGIEYKLIHQFLNSMKMDLHKIEYNSDLYKEYILGSAEVVGLMCLHVFVEGDKDKFEELKPYAMKLGSAFQKINFLRDLKDDYHILGRTYFPEVDMTQFTEMTKKSIEQDIKIEFQEALIGIRKLPISSRFGVYLAYKYYYSLFKKIESTPAQSILNERIRIPDARKVSMLLGCYFNYKIANNFA